LDVVYEEMFSEDKNDLKVVSTSEYTTFHHRQEDQSPVVGDTGCYDLKKSDIDEDGNHRAFKKSSALSKFRLVKSKLFHDKHTDVVDPNQLEDTVIFEDILDSSPERQTKRPESTPCENENVDDSCVEPLFGEQYDLAVEQSPASEKDINPIFRKSFKKSSSQKKDSGPPPVAEIIGHRRTNSDASDISSLSETKDNPLEFSLSNNGYREESPYMASLTEDIMQLLERRRTRSEPQRNSSGIPQTTDTMPKCFILLTDPMKRIFEIVPAPYEPEKTTVRDMLAKVPNMATDHRLKKQTYIGLAYQGVHLSEETVPKDAILDSLNERKPLLAIPANYSAQQMELIGNSLLKSPPVRKLLEDQLAVLEATPTSSSQVDHDNSRMMTPPSQMTQVVFCAPTGSQRVEV
jgi:hypothetical protein